MSDVEFSRLLKRVVGGETLDADDSAQAFSAIMSGNVDQAAIAALLTALAVRKPTVGEIVGAARAMREAMEIVEAPSNAIDLCGTGGDGQGTLNISTACAFVVAGAGVPVAKHGNRNMSSKSGAADVLEALGANIDVDASRASACLRETGVCFLFAQRYHPAIKFAAPVRRALGFRTIFNLLGPLTNPARVKRQLVGVFGKEWVEPIASAMNQLGSEFAWVVHGADGLDELSIAGNTNVAVLQDGSVREHTVMPEDADLRRTSLRALKGGTADENARALRRLFDGEQSAYRDIVLLNSAAALIVAGKARDLKHGVKCAAQSLDTGLARNTLDRFIAATREASP
jgi:anthranilate phosphoribosyltransferase